MMARELTSLESIEAEIERLKNSDAVRLARKEQRILAKRKSYLSALCSLEKRGRELAAEGITMENIREKMLGCIPEDEDYE